MLTRRLLLAGACSMLGGVAASCAPPRRATTSTAASDLGVHPGEDIGRELNLAIAKVSAEGGGQIDFVDGIYGTRVPITLRSGVTLKGSDSTIIRATAPIGNSQQLRSLIEQAESAHGCGIVDLSLECAGLVSFAAWRAAAPQDLVCHGVTITGWTFGLHFTSTAAMAGNGISIVRTSISQGGSRQVYPVFISSTVGGMPFLDVEIDELEIIGTGGSYTSTNAATADQLTLQNVDGFSLRNIVSRDGGENGISIVRGCRNGELVNIEVSGSDGQGCQIGGGGMVLTVDDPTPFTPGMQVRGASSEAEATVDRVDGNRIWISRLLARQFDEGEAVLAAGRSSRMSAPPSFCRDIHIDGIRCRYNGRNRGGAAGAFADLYITQAQSITLRNAKLEGQGGIGLLVNNSRDVPCGLSPLDGSSGTVRQTGRVICA